MKFKSSHDRDRVRGYIGTKDGKIIERYHHICFGRTFQENARKILKQKESEVYVFYFIDSLTEQSGSVDLTDSYIALLHECGAIVNGSISRTFSKEDKNIDVVFDLRHTQKTPFLKLEFDIDKCSSQELFLVGQLIRIVSTSPQIIVDYLELLKLTPDIDKSIVLQLAHMVYFSTRSQVSSNVLLQPGTALLRSKTFIDFYKEVEQTPIRTANSYYVNPLGGDNSIIDSYQNYFAHPQKYIRCFSEFYKRNHENALYRFGGVDYSPETIETFFDETKMMSSVYTKTFCKQPLLPPQGDK
jgi:hypothetical protein